MPRLSTPAEIRELLSKAPARLSEAQLLALVLGRGSRNAAGEPGERHHLTAVTLAEALCGAAGGRWAELVRRGLSGAIDWQRFGVGESLGGPLVATMELAQRWQHGFADGGDGRIRCAALRGLREAVFLRQEPATEGELVGLLLERSAEPEATAAALLQAFAGPQELVRSMSLERFAPAWQEGRRVLRLRGTEVDLEPVECCRLLAAIELVRRYPGQAVFHDFGQGEAAPGEGALDLLRLLDPASPLDGAQRSGLIEALRSHPRFTGAFSRLEELARDAGTESLAHAAELHRMFAALCRVRHWQHPAEVLGGRVPYAALLAIAEARIARTAEPPARLVEVRELLAAAEQQAAVPPMAAFVEALQDLRLSAAGLEKVLSGARSRYLSGRVEEARPCPS